MTTQFFIVFKPEEAKLCEQTIYFDITGQCACTKNNTHADFLLQSVECLSCLFSHFLGFISILVLLLKLKKQTYNRHEFFIYCVFSLYFMYLCLCVTTGCESRLPLTVVGEAIGPQIQFNYNVVDMKNVFVSDKGSYQVRLFTYNF